jgi:hypothetical protein
MVDGDDVGSRDRPHEVEVVREERVALLRPERVRDQKLDARAPPRRVDGGLQLCEGREQVAVRQIQMERRGELAGRLRAGTPVGQDADGRDAERREQEIAVVLPQLLVEGEGEFDIATDQLLRSVLAEQPRDGCRSRQEQARNDPKRPATHWFLLYVCILLAA